MPIPLEPRHRVTVDGRQVADRYVVSWACVAGHPPTHYVLIGYACAFDPGPAICDNRKEWFRLIDQRGRFADAGVPDDGPARDRLYSEPGIAPAMAAGVSMTPVIK